MKPLLLLTAALTALTATPALAQAPLLVTAQTPARNAPAISYATPITLTLSQPLDTSTASMAALRVFGSQRRGKLAGTASVSGNVLRFVPAHSLAPGEQVAISLTTAAQSSSGQALTEPYVGQFTVAAVGGTGVFGGGSDLAAGTSLRKFITGDVDGDGDVDVLTAGLPGGGGSVITGLLNDGQGTFSPGLSLPLTYTVNGLLLADVDNDSDLDLVTTSGNNALLNVRYNDGTGAFPTNTTVGVGNFPTSVVAGDIDGDGDLDLLTTCANGVGEVAVCLNTNGTFRHRLPDVGLGSFNGGPVDLALADLNGDGDLDLVTISGYNNTAAVCLNDSRGVFTPLASLPLTGGSTTVHPRRLVLGDINGDGNIDLLSVNTTYGAGSVSVRLGDGSGHFLGTTELTPPAPYDLALADVDGDHDLDMLTASNRANSYATVALNNGSGSFGPGSTAMVLVSPQGLATADVDGDGDLDLLTINGDYNGRASIRFNGGTGAALATHAAHAPSQALALYPNPAHEAVRVLRTSSGSAPVQLYDALGRLVRQAPAPAGTAEVELPLAGLPAGWYTVRSGTAVQALAVE